MGLSEKTAPFCKVRLNGGINTVSENEKAVVQKFSDKVDQHGQDQNKVFVPTNVGTGQDSSPPGGQRSEHQIEEGYFQHSDRNVVCGVKRKFAVERKIPQHRQD